MSNRYYVAGIPFSDELYHHGIKGQKWGVRRFENADGTLTEAGKQRYNTKLYARGARVSAIMRNKRRIGLHAAAAGTVGALSIPTIRNLVLMSTGGNAAAAGMAMPILLAPAMAISVGTIVKDYRDAKALDYYRKVTEDILNRRA